MKIELIGPWRKICETCMEITARNSRVSDWAIAKINDKPLCRDHIPDRYKEIVALLEIVDG